MIHLALDTETTGFPKKGQSRICYDQARICQIAMILFGDDGKNLAEVCFLVKPDGWTISQGAQDCHGHSMQKCTDFGFLEKTVFAVFTKLASMADDILAFNEEFDREMLAIEAEYLSEPMPDKPWLCAMKSCIDLCALPPTEKMIKSGRGDQFKTPSLEEAFEKLCGRKLGHFAHDAMYDVRALKEVYFATLKAKQQPAAAETLPLTGAKNG